jgi:hypothetical protein
MKHYLTTKFILKIFSNFFCGQTAWRGRGDFVNFIYISYCSFPLTGLAWQQNSIQLIPKLRCFWSCVWTDIKNYCQLYTLTSQKCILQTKKFYKMLLCWGVSNLRLLSFPNLSDPFWYFFLSSLSQLESWQNCWPEANVLKLFCPQFTDFHTQLECLLD